MSAIYLYCIQNERDYQYKMFKKVENNQQKRYTIKIEK